MRRNPIVMSPDKPGIRPGSNSIGRRYRTLSKPREVEDLEAAPLDYWQRQHRRRKNGLETVGDSSGVMAAARREGMHRDWRGPPGPAEKDRGER
jgi:hypothetical protein